MRDEEVQDHVHQPAGRQSCAGEGSQIDSLIPSLTQMQNDLRQLESAGAVCESQRDLVVTDAVRYDAWSQHAGRGGPVLRAAARQKAELNSEEGSHFPLRHKCRMA